MADFVFSKRAQRELAEALAWSLKQFGEAQTAKYDLLFRRVLPTLAESPNPGTPHSAKRGMFWLPVESHVIFYRVQPRVKRARIVRMLHKARLPSLRLL